MNLQNLSDLVNLVSVDYRFTKSLRFCKSRLFTQPPREVLAKGKADFSKEPQIFFKEPVELFQDIV